MLPNSEDMSVRLDAAVFCLLRTQKKVVAVPALPKKNNIIFEAEGVCYVFHKLDTVWFSLLD